MNKTILAVLAVSISALGLTACDVKKTQSGDVTLPKYEVEKTQQGNVTLPKYDVTTPDVKVGTKEEKIVVPTVKAEEKTIKVPDIEVTTGKEKQAAAAASADNTKKQ